MVVFIFFHHLQAHLLNHALPRLNLSISLAFLDITCPTLSALQTIKGIDQSIRRLLARQKDCISRLSTH